MYIIYLVNDLKYNIGYL